MLYPALMVAIILRVRETQRKNIERTLRAGDIQVLDMESDIWNAIQPGGFYFLLRAKMTMS